MRYDKKYYLNTYYMNIEPYLKHKTGRILISILLGFGLASLFQRACKKGKCMKLVAPPMKELENQSYKFEGDCYTFEKQASRCKKNKQKIPLAL